MDKLSHWPTRSQDLTIAQAVMARYAPYYPGGLPLIASYRFDDAREVCQVVFPEWIETLVAVVKSVYGEAHYSFIVDNIMTVLAQAWAQAGFIRTEDVPLFCALIHCHMRSTRDVLH